MPTRPSSNKDTLYHTARDLLKSLVNAVDATTDDTDDEADAELLKILWEARRFLDTHG